MRKETTPVDLNSVEPSPAKAVKKAAPRPTDIIPPIAGVGASSGGPELQQRNVTMPIVQAEHRKKVKN